jgi:hypothetical protein
MPSTAAFAPTTAYATPDQPVVLEGSEAPGGGGGSPASEAELAQVGEGNAAPLGVGEEAEGAALAALALSLAGDGSKEDPYLITNADDLMAFATDAAATSSNTNGTYYRLTVDIDLAVALDTTTWPLIQNFAGHLDGDFHTVSNFFLTSGETLVSKGFIGSGVAGGSIENLIVQGSITTSGNGSTGGIIGSASDFTLSNVGSEVNISSSNTQNNSNIYGGVVGTCTGGTVRDCYYNASLQSSCTQQYLLGGIVGNGTGVCIQNCLNLGSITYNGTPNPSSTGFRIGGICAGLNPSASTTFLINCVSVGAIIAATGPADPYIGGVVGYYGTAPVVYEYVFYSAGSHDSGIGSAVGTTDPAGVTKLLEDIVQGYGFAATDEYFEEPFLSYVEGGLSDPSFCAYDARCPRYHLFLN